MKKKKRNGQRKIPEILTPGEQSALLTEMASNGPWRNYGMAVVMLNGGLRVSEVVNLRGGDIDWETGRMVIRDGKGGKDRGVWLSPADLEILTKIPCPNPGAFLFVSKSLTQLSVRYVRYMILAAAKRAGVTKKVHPHMLRHTFATDLLRHCKSLPLVAKALGHSRIATTVIYTHIVDDEMEGAMKTMRNGHE